MPNITEHLFREIGRVKDIDMCPANTLIGCKIFKEVILPVIDSKDLLAKFDAYCRENLLE